jgi:hypothetical protein
MGTVNTRDDAQEVLQQQMETFVKGAKERLEPIDNWVRDMARERPLMLVAGAVGLGYVIGRVLRRI